MMKTYYLYLLLISYSLLSCNVQNAEPEDTYWIKGDLAEQGFNTEAVTAVIKQAKELPNFQALLVIRNNRLVVEEYYKGKDVNDLFHLRSITKNITSSIAGIALREGYINDVDKPIKEYFPNLITTEKETISIRHLLNMSSGLDWDEDVEINNVLNHSISDPISYVLSKDLINEPSTSFNYNTLSPHIVAQIISNKAETSLEDIAELKLFTPLDIDRYEWEKDPQGNTWGGSGLQLTARDLAKFGQLYLNEGKWDTQQVIPQSWINTSSLLQIKTPFDENSGYSNQWWTSTGLDTPIYYGQGYGGQALMLVPEKSMIVIAFQHHFTLPEQASGQWNNFLGKVFVPIYQAAN